MTDTSRPTIEALIAELGKIWNLRDDRIDAVADEAAEVLGALLTERDETEADRDWWHERHSNDMRRVVSERDAARAQIAEIDKFVADAAEVEAIMPNSLDREWISGLRAILRGVQDATEPTCNCAPDVSGRIIHNSWAHPEWEATEPSDILVQDVHATEQKRYTEPWQDPEPFYFPNTGTRRAHPFPGENYRKWPRSRAVYDAETKGEKP